MVQLLPRRALPPFLLLFSLLLSLLFGTDRANAQEEGQLAPAAPAPIAGAGAVNFVSQAVDAKLTRTQEGLYVVSSHSLLRLHNTNRFNSAAVTLGWPGWPGGNLRFNPAELPGFGSNLGTWRQRRQTSWGGEQRESEWLLAEMAIPPDTRRQITLNWQQTLGSGPLLTYSFGLMPASAWSGSVGSARVTLEFPGFLSEEALVHLEPEYYAFTGTALEWLVVQEEPTVNPTVTFIAPHFWREIEVARAAREADPVGANLRLSELYAQLDAAGADRYGDEAEAALDAAHRADPDNPEPLRRLAALYRSQAERAEKPLPLLEQSVTAAQAAIEAGADDAATRAALIEALQALADAWAEDDPTVALEYLERADGVADGSEQIAARQRALAEKLALADLEEGDFAGALRMAEQYGLPVDLSIFPWLESASARVENRAEARVVRFTVTGEKTVLDEHFAGLAEQLSESGFPASWKDNTLTIRLEGDLEARARAGQTVASSLDAEEEWDLFREVLLSHATAYQLVNDPLESQFRYREEIDIKTRAGEIAQRLRDEAAAVESDWERRLIEEAAARWEALQESHKVHVTTVFDAPGQPVKRDWGMGLPASEVLQWDGEVPRRDRLLWAGAAGALALLLVLGVIWLPGWRRATEHEPGN